MAAAVAAVVTAVAAAVARGQLHDAAAGLGEHWDRGSRDIIVAHAVVLNNKNNI